MTEKQELRKAMRAMRRGFSDEAQRIASEAACKRILAFAPYQEADCVMAYVACRGELDVSPVIEDILISGKHLVLPRCEADGIMTARRITSLDQLVSGAYGIPAPQETSEIVPPQEIDFILVPGTAFDRDGYRLGQGGGYYDRFMKETNAMRAGVCHDEALLERVPHEAHDLRMDAVITPGTLLLCGD